MEKDKNTIRKKNCILTVNGFINKKSLGVTDAHVHVWAKKYPSSLSYSIPEVNNYSLILSELINFKKSFGGSLIDCTPYECGRDGNKLHELSLKTGVNIISITGFHKREYYPPDSEIWTMNISKAQKFFTNEVEKGLKETIANRLNIRAGLIKIPFIGNLENRQLKILTDAAINSSIETNIPIMVHTERGLNVEFFIDYLKLRKVNPSKVVFCHVDKRNDFTFHKKLAKEGFFLEYDTFLREKYEPGKNTWLLISKMINEDLVGSIMLGSDISENSMWQKVNINNGLTGFFNNIKETALTRNISLKNLNKIIGENAAEFLCVS